MKARITNRPGALNSSPSPPLGRCRSVPDVTINALEAEIGDLVAQVAPQLVAERGCGPLTAAKRVGEIARADRFATDAKFARAAGIAPIPASSG